MLVGAVLLAWGGYRIRLGFRSANEDDATQKRGGLYAFQKRTHILFGVVYVIAAILLILGAFGISPLRR